jgi:hypothetical protein
LVLGILGAAATAAGCSSADTAPVVANVTLEVNKTRAALGSPIDLTYHFNVVEGATVPEGYRVLVHVLDDEGQVIWTHDHDPPMPTADWRSGTPIEYTRTIFIPAFPYLGEASLRVGLYRDNERVRLAGPDADENDSPAREYTVARFELLPQSENIFVIYQSGWHAPEVAADAPTREWQWTERQATLSFLNPKQDVTFYLEYDARPDLFGETPQTVTIWAGDQQVQSFSADQSMAILRRIDISAAQLGDAERTELRIDVDRSFVPAQQAGGGADVRELGVRVYHAHVERR